MIFFGSFGLSSTLTGSIDEPVPLCFPSPRTSISESDSSGASDAVSGERRERGAPLPFVLAFPRRFLLPSSLAPDVSLGGWVGEGGGQ